jgi:precorrin-3B synthase
MFGSKLFMAGKMLIASSRSPARAMSRRNADRTRFPRRRLRWRGPFCARRAIAASAGWGISSFNAAVFAAADLALSAPSPLRRKASQRDFLGVHVFGASTCVGAAPSLGRLTADDLRTLAQEAARCSAVDIRLTPWRALIVTGLDQARADDLAAALAQRGFILDPADPRLAIVACAGAPGCANAARAVQADALDLAPLIGGADGIVLHVSGCEKGCAHAKPAPLTLIARASGYDLVVNGKASDKPAREMISAGTIASVLAREYGALLR